MANQAITSTMIASLLLRGVVEYLHDLRPRGEMRYTDLFAVNGACKGDRVIIRKPGRFRACFNQTPLDASFDFIEETEAVNLGYQPNTPLLHFTNKDLMLIPDQFYKRFSEASAMFLGEFIAQKWPLRSTLVCADLPLPIGLDMAARIADPQLGLSLRLLRGYDINTGTFVARADLLIGFSGVAELSVLQKRKMRVLEQERARLLKQLEQIRQRAA